jgi:hypothetical protein
VAVPKIRQDMDDLSNFGSHLCVTCKPKKRHLSGITGECAECGRMTSDRAYRVCRACAERSHVCQLCSEPCVTTEA